MYACPGAFVNCSGAFAYLKKLFVETVEDIELTDEHQSAPAQAAVGC